MCLNVQKVSKGKVLILKRLNLTAVAIVGEVSFNC